MKRSRLQVITFLSLTLVLVSGCATTRAHKPDAAKDPQSQITDRKGDIENAATSALRDAVGKEITCTVDIATQTPKCTGF